MLNASMRSPIFFKVLCFLPLQLTARRIIHSMQYHVQWRPGTIAAPPRLWLEFTALDRYPIFWYKQAIEHIVTCNILNNINNPNEPFHSLIRGHGLSRQLMTPAYTTCEMRLPQQILRSLIRGS
jgi:hypothetical protein